MYYVAVIKDYSRIINEYATKDQAMEIYHSELTYAYNQKINTSVYLLDKYGSKPTFERADFNEAVAE